MGGAVLTTAVSNAVDRYVLRWLATYTTRTLAGRQ